MGKVLCFFLILLLLTYSCDNRNDKVFIASDELHSIALFEKMEEFELMYNGLNTAVGNYSLSKDTIFLTYAKNQFEAFDPNEKLTRLILIDRKLNSVNSIDNKMQFCADISFDALPLE